MEEAIRYDRGDDDIVILTLDAPDQSANTMNARYSAAMEDLLARLEDEKDDIAGVVVTSAKSTFFAGGDLTDLRAASTERTRELAHTVHETKRQLRRLETLGKPVVAAINGAALGGGLEICLACHHRIVVADRKAVVGFPEVQLGLMPGGGGVVRTVRLLGIVDALTHALLRGQRHEPVSAKAIGFVDEIVPSVSDLLPAAKSWIAANPWWVQPWDRDDYEVPGGTPSSPELVQLLPTLPANLRKQLKGARYPAQHHIMASAVETAQVDFDTASEIEGRYFVNLANSQIAKNMIQAFFFDLQRVRGARGRPSNIANSEARKVVVLGAGMMGAAIAYVCAKAGIQVVLKDVSLDASERGLRVSIDLVENEISKGRATREEADAMLARITPTADVAAAAGADFVIEAVVEDPKVKEQVFAEVEPYLAEGALLGSNTSTLPITDLAAGARPENFIGLHFFSPVDRMPLLEVIQGRQTSKETLYRALDFARQIGKTPIVVNDSRGFFTSRVIAAFVDEGISMLAEGVPAPSIEQASAQAGYPVPVLQLSDELNLNLMRTIRMQYESAARAQGHEWNAHPAEQVIDRMLDEFGRGGKRAGAGFYDYQDGKRTRLWPGLRDSFPVVADPATISLRDLVERMLFVEAIEAVKCLDEGVIESVADANVGSILGIGFPGWTGGVLQYINGYDASLPGFVARARALASRFGPRFEPPASLVEKSERGDRYTDEQP